jgi:hypothetical protein
LTHAELRRELRQLADEFDVRLIDRYALRSPPAYRVSVYRRLRALAGAVLRRTGLRRRLQAELWVPGLEHEPGGGEARALLVWAPGMDRASVRSACAALRGLQSQLPGRAPVLVTDVADFAYFSRLGWLVEYVPTFSAPADSYNGRKLRYLAWRYRDAPAIPASIALSRDFDVQDLDIV